MRFISLLILLAAALVGLITAYRYFTRRDFMPYQEAAAGVRFDELGPGLRIVIQAMMHVIGGGFAGLAISLIWLSIALFKGEVWAGYAILTVTAATLGPTLFAVRHIAELGHHDQPPTYLLSGVALAIVIAVLFTYL